MVVVRRCPSLLSAVCRQATVGGCGLWLWLPVAVLLTVDVLVTVHTCNILAVYTLNTPNDGVQCTGLSPAVDALRP